MISIIGLNTRVIIQLLLIGLLACTSSCSIENTVTDIDGNTYSTVKIGPQTWLAENLKTTRYRNGDPILQTPDSVGWISIKQGAYCCYNNDTSHINVYGLLYNNYAVTDSRGIAPAGWHIPSAEEIAALVNYLHGDTIAATKMKVAGTEHWLYRNESSTNESGFSAFPGGYRHGTIGGFHTMGSNGYWWSTTKSYEMFAWSPRLFDVFADVSRDKQYLTYGFAVRCVKDK